MRACHRNTQSPPPLLLPPTGVLQARDRDLAGLCEEKEACLAEILSEMGHEPVNPTPQYRQLLDEHSLDPAQARDLQIRSITVSF